MSKRAFRRKRKRKRLPQQSLETAAALGRMLQTKIETDNIEKEGRDMRRIARRISQKRVLKPKRRKPYQKDRVVIRSIRGVEV